MSGEETGSSLVISYSGGEVREERHQPVREFPLLLMVNGREIATLIASPHELRYLVAGFLRLQGFVRNLDEFEMFSVCEDMGVANVRIKGEVPERLKPVLTTGCGTGITFSLSASAPSAATGAHAEARYSPEAVFNLMNHLARQAERYRDQGGIHSAAVGDGAGLFLWAEDIGRHNTLDRIAGEALFRGINLAGTMLVTSGRISSEMVAKGATLGIALIASRTSPTDMAVRIGRDAGITVIGYLRGGKFNVYCHPERLGLQGLPPGTG